MRALEGLNAHEIYGYAFNSFFQLPHIFNINHILILGNYLSELRII